MSRRHQPNDHFNRLFDPGSSNGTHACHWRLTPKHGSPDQLRAMLRGEIYSPPEAQCQPRSCPWAYDCENHRRWGHPQRRNGA
jgi:hypothetical protein